MVSGHDNKAVYAADGVTISQAADPYTAVTLRILGGTASSTAAQITVKSGATVEFVIEHVIAFATAPSF